MGAISVTAASVKLMNENEVIKIRGTVGATITPGQFVYLDGTNGWKPADADALASSQGRGVALSDAWGSVSFAVGQAIDIVILGRVGGFASMTPGGAVFGSVSAGSGDQTPATLGDDYNFAMGWAESATVLFVQPQITVPTINPC